MKKKSRHSKIRSLTALLLSGFVLLTGIPGVAVSQPGLLTAWAAQEPQDAASADTNAAGQTLPRTAAPSDSLTVWDGTVSDSFAGGTGSWDDPYQISNGGELAHLASLMENEETRLYDRHFVLTQDILLNDVADWTRWTEQAPANIFQGIDYFTGTFDGNHHTIYGMYAQNGLFKAVHLDTMYDFILKNLNLCDCVVSNPGDEDYPHAGGIIGQMTGATGSNTAVDGTGSVVSAKENSITDCSFHGIVTGSGACGGVIGYINVGSGTDDWAQLPMAHLRSDALVASTGACSGGIIGYMEETSSKITLDYCDNYGEISGPEDDRAGGIIGWFHAESYSDGGSYVYLYACRNTGRITGGGGIAGFVRSSDLSVVNIGSCFNSDAGTNGLIGSYDVEENASLSLYNNFFRAGDYASMTANPDSENGVNDSGNYALTQQQWDEARLPYGSDAEDAIRYGRTYESGEYIYYGGYFNRIYRANRDGTDERMISSYLLSYPGNDLYQNGNDLYYMKNSEDGQSTEICALDMETGQEQELFSTFGGVCSLMGMADGSLFFSVGSDAYQVYKISPERTRSSISFEGLEDSWYQPYLADGCIAFLVMDADYVPSYSFYRTDGSLIRENVFAGKTDFVSFLDGEVFITMEDRIEHYDVQSDTYTTLVSFSSPGEGQVGKVAAVSDHYVFTYPADGGQYQKIDRNSGSIFSCEYWEFQYILKNASKESELTADSGLSGDAAGAEETDDSPAATSRPVLVREVGTSYWTDPPYETVTTTLYTYDAYGRLSGETSDDSSATGIQYQYDAQGVLSEKDVSYSGSLRRRTVYTNDSDGNVLRQEDYDASSNELEDEYEYTYNERGDVLTESYVLYSNGNVFLHHLYRHAYEYDDHGNIVRDNRTYDRDSADDLLADLDTVYEYDTEGKMTMSLATSSSEDNLMMIFTIRTEYSYDQGLLTEERSETVRSDQETDIRIIRYEYNADGLLSKKSEYSGAEEELQKVTEYHYSNESA